MDGDMEAYPDVFRILSIDPGGFSLGTAISELDLESGSLHVLHAETLSADKLIKDDQWIANIHGDKVARHLAIQMAITAIMYRWSIRCVVCESPYMGRFPQAFAALVECVSTIRRGVMKYDINQPFVTIDPATIKTAVGVSGKSGNKDHMALAIRKLDGLSFSPDMDLDKLDEHSVDAIAIGYAHVKLNIMKGIPSCQIINKNQKVKKTRK